MGRWKASAGPGYIHPGGLISCGIFYYLLQKANTLNVLPPIPFPSFLPISLPSFFPSPLSLSLPFLFFNFRQWQVEISPEFSVRLCHVFQWVWAKGWWGRRNRQHERNYSHSPFLLCNSRDYNPHLSRHLYIITWGGGGGAILLLLSSRNGKKKKKKRKSFLFLVMHLHFLTGLLWMAI